MITKEMLIQKAEHDAQWANAQAEVNKANIDYLCMMTDVDIPTEEEQEANEE